MTQETATSKSVERASDIREQAQRIAQAIIANDRDLDTPIYRQQLEQIIEKVLA